MPGAFMLAVLIVYLPNQGNFPTTLGVMGLNMFNILFMLTVAVLVLQPPAAAGTPRAPKPPFTNVLVAYYAVFALALMVALLRGSAHPIDDIVAYKNIITYSLLYFLAYYGVRSLHQVRLLIALVVLVFAAAAVEAVLQGLAFGLQDYDNQQRASGPFGDGADNANFAGVFYAIFATFALAIALLGRQLKFRYRLLAALAYGIGCLGIIATFSRQAFLVIGVTTLLLALRRNPLMAALAVGGMLAYPLWAPQGVIERIEMTQQTTSSGQEVLESSAASRYELWSAALQIIREHPAGIGLNQFHDEVEPYLPEWVEARDAQNQYLRVAAEAGVQGLVVFVLLLISFMRLGLRVRGLRHPPDARLLGTAFFVSTLAVWLGNLFSSTFSFGEIMANFWILAGLLARFLVLAEQEQPAAARAGAASEIEQMRQVYARWQRRTQQAGR